MATPTTWWNREHASKSSWRSRTLKRIVQDLLDGATACTNHTARGSTLPVVIDGLERAGVPYRITKIVIAGRGDYVVERL